MNRISTAVLLSGLCFASVAVADTLTFMPLTGDLGTATQTYTLGGVSVIVTGFNGGDLYGKNAGTNEMGLGLTKDPSGQNEIFIAKTGAPTPFVQVDFSKLIKAGFTSFQFEINSTQGNERWQVAACAISGTLCTAGALTGTDQVLNGAPFNLSAADPYLDVSMAGSATKGNVLLAEIAAKSVPEPATLGLFGLGLVGVGIARWRRKR